ncbi:site-2 protease family protein [Alphaproteobacteria bacterium]|nr:site-2 protease family protein [Alphaproteobacteria bacterium]
MISQGIPFSERGGLALEKADWSSYSVSTFIFRNERETMINLDIGALLGQLQNVAMYVLPFLAMITVLVFFHELGHYFSARRHGVKIEAFAIGLGKELFGWDDRHGTRWKFCMFPMGGYVKMFSDSDPASSPDGEKNRCDDRRRKSGLYVP